MTIAFGPQDIQREHDWLGCQLGWRFLYAPERTLREADVALITLNPGGDRYQPPAWSYEGGDAYCSERWGDCEPGAHALQRQVQRLFAIMSVEPTAVLSGVLVPFRSRRWESWPQQADALAFARRLWRSVFDAHRPRTIVCVGKDPTGREVRHLLDAREERRLPSMWGAQTIDRYGYEGGRLIVLPHLSAFKLFGDSRRERAFLAALG